MLCCAQKASIVGNIEKETFEFSGKEKRFYVVFEFVKECSSVLESTGQTWLTRVLVKMGR